MAARIPVPAARLPVRSERLVFRLAMFLDRNPPRTVITIGSIFVNTPLLIPVFYSSDKIRHVSGAKNHS